METGVRNPERSLGTRRERHLNIGKPSDLGEAAIALSRCEDRAAFETTAAYWLAVLAGAGSASVSLSSEYRPGNPGGALRSALGEAYGAYEVASPSDPDGLRAAVDLVSALGERFNLRDTLAAVRSAERARRQEMEILLDTVPAAVLIAHDAASKQITGNRASYDLLRLPYGANASKSAEDGSAPTNFKVFKDGRQLDASELPVQMAASSGQVIEDFEEEVVFDDGEVRYLLGNASPLRDDENRVRGAVAAFFDITKRVEMEAELRDSESTYRFLVGLDEEVRDLVTPEAVLRRTIQMLTQYLGMAGGAFVAPDREGALRIFVHGGLVEKALGSGLLAKIRSVIGANGAGDGGDTPDLSEVGVGALLMAPVYRGDRLRALLVVVSDSPRTWTASDRRLLEFALERAWSHAERARSEMVQVQGARRYRALAEAAATLVFTADELGNITTVPFVRNLASLREEIGGSDGWMSVVHPDDKSDLVEAWQRAVDAREPLVHPFRLKTADGQYRWQIVRAVHVQAMDDQPGEWVGACVDAHERVTKERTIQLVNEFTARTREMDDPNAMIALAQQLLGEELQVTRCAYGESYADGRKFAGPPNYCVDCEDLSQKYPLAPVDSRVTRDLRAGKVLHLNDVAIDLAGDSGREQFLVNKIASALCVPVMQEGRMAAIFGVHQDRPRAWTSDEVELVRVMAERTWSELERVRASLAVGRSEQRLRRTLEAATVGVVIRDETGKLLYANRPFLQLLDYREPDFTSGSVRWRDILSPSYREIDAAASRELASTGSCRPYECEFVARDGQRIAVYIGAASVPDTEGGQRLQAIFVTDLSPIKEAERQLVRLNESLERRVAERTAELQAANREMEGFTYTVAHDLRSPLRAIVATSSILLEELGPELSDEHRYLLERQSSNAQHLAHLLDDLLVYARISRQDVVRQTVNFSQVAQSVALEVGEDGGERVQVEEGLWAVADPNLLKLVLQNLIENACKFSPRGTPVYVGQEETDRGWAFYVRDEGVGFDMKHSQKLFEPFIRLVHQSEFPGTGIGLANVKRVVERHGGQVWVYASPEKGAKFWFTLPDSESVAHS